MSNIGALIIIIRFSGPLYCNYNKEPPEQCWYSKPSVSMSETPKLQTWPEARPMANSLPSGSFCLSLPKAVPNVEALIIRTVFRGILYHNAIIITRNHQNIVGNYKGPKITTICFGRIILVPHLQGFRTDEGLSMVSSFRFKVKLKVTFCDRHTSLTCRTTEFQGIWQMHRRGLRRSHIGHIGLQNSGLA